jgi:N6-adenosine-specific RNA methylase IME4
MNELIISNLKQRLDEIDATVYGEVFNGFCGSRLRILIGIWEKGEVVSKYRGVNLDISFRQLEKMTGRSGEYLKRWNDIYEKYPDKDKYIEEVAKPRAIDWTRNALEEKGVKDKPPLPLPPPGKFAVIMIDPPWPYGTEYDKNTRRVASPYPEMKVYPENSEDGDPCLTKLDIPGADHSALWLWTTHKFLLDAFTLMNLWGYEYKLTIGWNKGKMGIGQWLRCQMEFCLLGIKGKPDWHLTNQIDYIEEPRREHSRKPNRIYKMAEELFPGPPDDTFYLDYFSREKRAGWAQAGNELSKF